MFCYISILCFTAAIYLKKDKALEEMIFWIAFLYVILSLFLSLLTILLDMHLLENLKLLSSFKFLKSMYACSFDIKIFIYECLLYICTLILWWKYFSFEWYILKLLEIEVVVSTLNSKYNTKEEGIIPWYSRAWKLIHEWITVIHLSNMS